MHVNGTKPVGMMSTEAHPSHVVLYQVCVDRDGDAPLDGTGVQFDDQAKAILHLEETQQAKPYAYLATVTYQRWNENGAERARHEQGCQCGGKNQFSAENMESIASFSRHGMRATERLQALRNLLSQIRPAEGQDPVKLVADLVIAVRGMDAYLQTIHDAFDNIGIRAEPDDALPSFANMESASQNEPAMV